MPVKRRVDKRRAALSENEERWLRGQDSGFIQFKPHEELVLLWPTHGDSEITDLDMCKNTKPQAKTA